MRIQHNIAALNSYRNLTNNNSAVAKNLEKLSSGYRINRAGDDAAGLAISEKMRAQITGLQTAQKNANDGISLVQTAEGALTEVHSMLNRMVELATQSANGTYADAVDRENLQAEIESLTDEINRISQSTNFNGINLLDGSMDAEGTKTNGTFTIGGTGIGALPGVGGTLGTNTVLHQSAAEAIDKTTFAVDLHNLSFSNKTGETLKLTIGENEYTLAGDDGGAMEAADIAAALKAGKFKDADGTAVAANAFKFEDADGNEVTFNVDASGTRITFTEADNQTGKINGDMTVKVEGVPVPGAAATPAKEAVYKSAVTVANNTFQDNDSIIIKGAGAAGADLTINVKTTTGGANDISVTDANDATKLAAFIAGKIDAMYDDYNVTSDGSNIIWTAKQAGAIGTSGPADVPADLDITFNGNGGGAAATVETTPNEDTKGAEAGAAGEAGANPVKGDYNVRTTVIENKTDATDERLASTKFSLTEAMVADGGYVRIGDTEYTFTTDPTKTAGKNQKLIDISDLVDEKGALKTGALDIAAERLTKAAEDNDVYTVGHGNHGDATITVTENVGYSDAANKPKYDLTTEEGIEASLGFGTVTKHANGKALTLQIGDTSQDFNKLTLSIGSTSADALGIGSIDIGSQEGAADAISKIKDAINKVSSTRGDLGAVQNRLEHTINNLSVQTENITAAESRIRDVDMAEEMMAYTKNNILVQAAQAMLAQANQVPQGVLQLLQ